MPNPQPFQAVPAPRCCAILSSSPLTICNRPATWKGHLEIGDVTPVWCDRCKPDTAAIASGVLRVRRIIVDGPIVLTSAVESYQLAKAEAVARLVRAVADAGGLLTRPVITCQTGYWTVPPASGRPNASGGGG